MSNQSSLRSHDKDYGDLRIIDLYDPNITLKSTTKDFERNLPLMKKV